MKDNGKRILCMDKVNFIGKGRNMLENIIMDKNMVKESITGIQRLIMMENGIMEFRMDKEF